MSYDPVANSWAVNSPVPAFANARRNFPTDTDGTTRIWLAGGYDVDWHHTIRLGRTVLPGRWNANSNANGNSYCNGNSNSNSNGYCNSDGNGHRHSISNGDGYCRLRRPPPQHPQRRHHHQDLGYANTAASADASASPITAVAASLPATPKLREGGCEAQSWTIISAVDARLTETRLQRHSI